MANIKVKQMSSSDTYNPALGLKDGSAVSIPWVQAMLFKGHVFHAYVGSATSPATLDAAYAATDPDISVDVPDGTAIIPLCIRLEVEAYGTTALFETFTLCTKTLAAATGTVFTPINMNTRHSRGSACSVYTGPTVTDGSGAVGAFEIGRHTQSKAVTIATADDDSTWQPAMFEWSYLTAGFAPVLRGEASMQTWAIAQAITGYLQYWWLELNESEVDY